MHSARAILTSVGLLLSVVGLAYGQEGPATPAIAADNPQSWALLVGVNAYSEIRPLNYCVPDMEALREKLTDAGFAADNVFLLTDTAAELKYKPTRNNILRQLEVLVQIIGPKDKLVVAFSGHGVHFNNTSYYCPADANLVKPAETLVPLDKVYQMIDSCEAQVKVLLVDACRNDPFRPGDKSAADAVKAAGLRGVTGEGESLPEGIVLLSSCKRGQESYEDENLRHGVFMHFLLKGLEGEADADQDTSVSLLELYKFAEVKTRVYVARSRNAAQVPTMRGDFASDPVIALVPKRISNRVDEVKPAAEPAPVASSDNPGVKSLLLQGNNFFATGEYDNAIHAYNNAIMKDPQNPALYVKRGAAYRGKGDIKMAVIDYQAAGQGLMLNVTAATAPLRDGDKVTATVRQGQSLSVTKIQNFSGNDWLWVSTVDGNDAAQGWLQMSAVEPPKPAPAPAAPSAPQPAAQPAANNQNYYDPSQYYNYDYGDGGRSTPAMDAAENKLDRLYDRYDNNPTPALERQIEAQERRMERMRGD